MDAIRASLASIRWAALCLVCISTTINTATAQLPKCLFPHHSGGRIGSQASMVTRFSPMPAASKPIPADGMSLAQVIYPDDLQAVAVSHIQSRLVTGQLPLDTYRHWLAQSDTPDTAALIRGQQITLFPRVFLLHPNLSRMQILPGDSLVTFSLSSSQDEINDPIQHFIERQLDFKSAAGSNLDEGRRVIKVSAINGKRELTILEIPSGQSLGNSLPWDYESDLSEYFNGRPGGKREQVEWESLFGSLAAMHVVRRNVGNFQIQWWIPSKHYGSFSYKGSMFYRLLTEAYWRAEFDSPLHDPRGRYPLEIGPESAEKLAEQWNGMLSRFSSITLSAGDRIEFTTLEGHLLHRR